ncbi:MAG: type II CAAX endopeptidase family protein [Planctomycetota bacterium]
MEDSFFPPNPEVTEAELASDIATANSTAADTDQIRPRKSVGLVFVSWAMVLLVAFGIAALVAASQFLVPKSMELSGAEKIQIELIAKTLVGIAQPESQAMEQIAGFKTGPLEQRWCHVILVNEIQGPDAAIEQLLQVDQDLDQAVAKREELRPVDTVTSDESKETDPEDFPNDTQIAVRSTLGQLLQQYSNGNLDSGDLGEEEKQQLIDRLGWPGRLLLYPKESPNEEAREKLESEGFKTIIVATLAMVAGFFAIIGALVAVFALMAIFAARGVRPRFYDPTNYSFVYIETFAIWLVGFFGSQVLLQQLLAVFQFEKWTLALTPVIFFGSLIVLAWPRIRGIPFGKIRKDIGLELRNPFVEVAIGGVSYFALMIPMVVGIGISVLIGLGLSMIETIQDFESTGPAGHPIADEIAAGGWMSSIMIIVSACVAAPIVEEIMFRGVLYRYLRDMTSKNKARGISVAGSSIVGGLIFAMVHPQGLIGIPILTTLAIGFSLVREWRNSLIAPMVMHAMNNGIVTCLLLSLLS